MGRNLCRIRRDVLRARRLVVRGTCAAGSGHPGGSFSMAEILGCLFGGRLRFDPADPGWEGRDRLVLSKGHAAPGLYAAMAVAGYFDESEVVTLRKLGSRLQGHPDLKCPGVEFCGGSLGTGLSYAVGVALAARMDSSGARVYAVLGDGETDEGQVWEAAMTAAKYKLGNLVALLDRNYIQQDSHTEQVMPLDAGGGAAADKWRAFGWNVVEVDGHRAEQVDSALGGAAGAGAPTMVVARTVKGRSVEHMEGNPGWHGRAPDPDMAPVIEMELGAQEVVAPSVTAGDASDLAGEVRRCAEGGADYIHLDVMDGRFVPARSLGPGKVRELRPLTDVPFDTHLMVEDPGACVDDYVEAGSDIVTVHAEAVDAAGFGEICDRLGAAGVGRGLAINPGTELPGWAREFLPSLDQLVVMSVEPGRSGQRYIEGTRDKMARLMPELAGGGFAGLVEADGGINRGNAGAAFAGGARVLVGGGAIAGQADAAGAIRGFREAARAARRRMLLEEAGRIGGPGMVERWMGLHVAGGAREELGAIAREAGLA